MSDWLKQYHDARDDIQKAINILKCFADAFHCLDQRDMAFALSECIRRLETAVQKSQTAITLSIDERLKESQQGIASVLNALINKK